MIKQVVVLLAAATVTLALGDGRAYYSKKTFQSQGPSQYSSVASFHASKPLQPVAAGAQPQPQQAPSPYAFGYDSDGSARQESGDASGKVTGSYKVTNEDGSIRHVKYVADENGFRADIDTNEPGTKSDNPADVTFKSAAPVRHDAPTRYSSQNYGQKPQISMGAYEQTPIQFTMGSNGGAYSYNYQSKLEDGGSSAQSETADGSGKVSGYYSMSAADGRNRKVDYTADAAGFNAAVQTNELGTKSDSPANVQFFSSAPQQPAGPSASSYAHSSFQQQQQVQQYSVPAFGQQPYQQSSPISDSQPSPYAFSYDAQLEDGSSSRTESADASGKVVGSYSLATADGRKRIIKYEADKDGFRANVDTNEFGTKSDSPANVNFYSSAPQPALDAPTYSAAPQQPAPAAAFPLQQSKIGAGSGITSTFQAPAVIYQGQPSIMYSGAAGDDKPAPYAFNYLAQLDDGSVSRTESGDESGKVVGSYSLSVADGRQRKVDYLADKAGFRATVNTNEFGTKADSPADVQFYSTATDAEPAPYSSPNAYRPSSSASSASMYSASAAQRQIAQHAVHFRMGEGDRAYSYNYQTKLEDGGSNAQSETADASGKVTGFYSMEIPDGRRRKVDYTADSSGFQASVDTNEFGTKSDSPAHVSFMSSAPQPAPEAPRSPMSFVAPQISAPKPSGSVSMYTPYVSQQQIEPAQVFQPSPYSFNYEAAATGGSSSRKESADASGTVTGTYEVQNEDGSRRVVEYIADKGGFRANVKTNEPGTKSDHPADVTVKSDAPSAPLEHSPAGAQFPARTYTPKSSMTGRKY